MLGAILNQGNRVVVIDDSSVVSMEIRKSGVKVYKISIDDNKKVRGVFKKEKPDFVFHLAGAINLRKGITTPLFLKDANFLSRTKIILDVCKKNNVKKIIFISSGGAIYENAKILPTSEKYLAHPGSLYGLANIMIEKYIEFYCKNYNLNFTIPRLSNVYGPRQWESGFIPAVIIKMLKKERPVIYGTGRQTRDFIYIDDVVEALMMLAEHGKREVYNVGSGQEISLKKLFTLVNNLLGAKVKPVHEKPRFFEVQRSTLDISKIQKEMDWRPKTDIKTGLLKTIEWFKKEK